MMIIKRNEAPKATYEAAIETFIRVWLPVRHEFKLIGFFFDSPLFSVLFTHVGLAISIYNIREARFELGIRVRKQL